MTALTTGRRTEEHFYVSENGVSTLIFGRNPSAALALIAGRWVPSAVLRRQVPLPAFS